MNKDYLFGLLGTIDELNLYLVANGLKPASDLNVTPKGISIRAKEFGLEDKTHLTEETRDGKKCSIFSIHQEDLQRFRDAFEDLGIAYLTEDREVEPNETGEPTIQRMFFAKIGRDRACLDLLLNARSRTEKGLAYGFPPEAVDAFLKEVDGKVIDGAYEFVNLAIARDLGIELPSWLAYKSFVSEKLDFAKGEISESTKTLCESYQRFVRKNHPDLASRVERRFFDIVWPTGWELDRHGHYNLQWNLGN